MKKPTIKSVFSHLSAGGRQQADIIKTEKTVIAHFING